jgi:hypothetical protein
MSGLHSLSCDFAGTRRLVSVSCKLFLIILLFVNFLGVTVAQKVNPGPSCVIIEQPISENDFPVVSLTGTASVINYDNSDYPGVIRAMHDLQNDIESVTGKRPLLVSNTEAPEFEILIGTLGKNKQIDKLVSSKKLDVKDIEGKWESFVITTIANPAKNIKNSLVIVGSDKRGTIYGIYELSKQLGVSPWYWWADVPAKNRVSAYVKSGSYASGEPKVKYRGIFINNEAPAFSGWASEKFGGANSRAYANDLS